MPSRRCRPISWAAMSSAASAAIAPNTPSAIDSGSIARSAVATIVDVDDFAAERPFQLRNASELGLHSRHVAAAAVDLIKVDV